jgi:scyllo-inositol 2-dehydrogenase (NADP+)
MDPVIEVGLVGFGLAGKSFHAPVIRAVPGLHLAAIVQRTRNEAATLYPDAKLVRSLDELLKIETIRLIVIATPNQVHFPLVRKCLEAGRDVVVDKPVTTTLAEAKELYKIAGKYGRLLTVYHNRRFDADFQAIRGVLASGELGRVVRFESFYDRFRPVPKPGAWREKPQPGSGVLFDLGPHLIDHALTLFGKPEGIGADIRTEREAFLTDDAFDLFLQYSGNLRVQLSATMLAAIPRPRFRIFGTQGSLIKRDFDPLEPTLRSGTVPSDGSWVVEEEENFAELTVVNNGQAIRRKVPSIGDWRDFYANVRDVLLNKAELLVTPRQVLDVMLMLELAIKSSRHQRFVAWSEGTVSDV